MKKCNIFLNGEGYSGEIEHNYTICADGGYSIFRGTADVFVGDMDSCYNKSISAKEFIRHDPIKDYSDGESAVDIALERGFRDITFYGVDGGRLDHILTNLNVMAKAYSAGARVRAVCEKYTIYFTDKPFTASGVKGKTVSLVPFDDRVHIMSTEGLYYPLTDAVVERRSSLCVSNVATADDIRFDIAEGSCFIFLLND